MKLLKNLRQVSIIITLAATLVFMSCDMFEDTEDYDISIMIICSGSASQEFKATVILDGKIPISLPPSTNDVIIPAGKISTATITATRTDSEDSLLILVYKDNELDEKGFALLETCTTGGTTTCSDTLNLAYKVTDDDSKAISGKSDKVDEEAAE